MSRVHFQKLLSELGIKVSLGTRGTTKEALKNRYEEVLQLPIHVDEYEEPVDRVAQVADNWNRRIPREGRRRNGRPRLPFLVLDPDREQDQELQEEQNDRETVLERRIFVANQIFNPPNVWTANSQNEQEIIQPGEYFISCDVVLNSPKWEEGDENRERNTRYTSIRVDRQMKLWQVTRPYIGNWINSIYDHQYEVNLLHVLSIKLEPFRQIGGPLNVELGNTKLQHKMFPNDKLIAPNPGTCVIDSLHYHLKKHWTKLTRAELVDAFHGQETNITAKQIMQFLENSHYKAYVSCYILDPFNRVCSQTVAKSGHTEVSMCFQINNGHLYSITSDDDRNKICFSKKKFVDLQPRFVNINYETEKVFSIDNINRAKFNPDAFIDQLGKINLADTTDLSDIFKLIVTKTETMPNYMYLKKQNLTCFNIEINGVTSTFVTSPDYFARKEILAKLFKKSNYDGFFWRNQSYAQIAHSIYLYYFGELPKSTYNQHHLHILQKCRASQYNAAVSKKIPYNEEVFSIDTCKQFTSLLLQNKYPWIITNCCDQVRNTTSQDLEIFKNRVGKIWSKEISIQPGMYYVNKPFGLCDEIKWKNNWITHAKLDVLLEDNMIDPSDVTQCLISTQFLDPAVFVNFAKFILKQFPGKDAKQLINCFIGALNKVFNESKRTALTSSLDMAIAMSEEFKDLEIIPYGGNFVIQHTERKELYEGHSFIWRQIMDLSHISLMNLVKSVKTEYSTVYGVTSDAVKLSYPNFDNVKPKCECKPGDYHKETHVMIRGNEPGFWEAHSPIELPQIYEIESDSKEFENYTKPALYFGRPGFGKSYHLSNVVYKNLIDNGQKVIVLAPTHNACHNLRKMGIKNENISTLDKAFQMIPDTEMDNLDKEAAIKYAQSWLSILIKNDAIIVDEVSMMKKVFLHKLMILKRLKPELKIYLFGDVENQCLPYEDVDNLPYRYTDLALIDYLTEYTRVKMVYIPNKTRVKCAILKEVLDYFVIHQELPTTIVNPDTGTKVYLNNKQPHENCKRYITLSRKCRAEVNDEIYEGIHDKTKNIPYVSTKPFWPYGDQMNQDHALENRRMIQNNEQFISLGQDRVRGDNCLEDPKYICLKSVSSPKGTQDELIFKIKKKYMSQFLRLNYADTVMRVQGQTITEKFNILETSNMRFEQFYTSLSRATTWDNVGFDYKEASSYFNRCSDCPKIDETSIKQLTPFCGRIYKFVDGPNDELLKYIGKTINKLESRLKQHKLSPVNEKMKIWLQGIKKPKMMQITERMFVYPRELSKLEIDYIVKLEPELNQYNNPIKKAKDKLLKNEALLETKNVDVRFNVICDYARRRYCISYYVPKTDSDGNMIRNKQNKVEKTRLKEYFSWAKTGKQDEAESLAFARKIELQKIYI